MTEMYERLENEFADFVGLRSGEMVACSSGTAALHLALEALTCPRGAQVLMSDFNMIACPRAATLANLRPIFLDCTEDLLLDTSQLPPEENEALVVMPVHIYGRRCDMTAVHLWANTYFNYVVEDMSEIHGVAPHEESDAACWSFYKNKIIAGEEGGMVWFQDPGIAKIAKELRSLGFNDQHNYLHRPRGHNYRLSNCHAELIFKSLLAYSANNARRHQIEDWYNKYIPLDWQMPLRDAVWVYDLRIKGLGFKKMDLLIRELNGKGIAARHGFKPMTMQPEYLMSGIENFNAFKASQEVLYLPVYPSITEAEVKANVETLKEAYHKAPA